MTDAVANNLSPAAAPMADGGWFKLYLGFGGMVLGQFMAMLDINIVASSLPQIQAGLGASLDEIGWVQSMFLLAEVVTIPLAAYFSKLWGTRAFYMGATIAFVVTSLIAGLVNDFEAMILARALQGLAAGAMIPTVLATAWSAFPLERRVTAQVITSVVVSLAPTIGPTLGGHLTEWLSWRWLFFINAPAGLVVLFLVGRYADFDKPDPRLGKGIDWFGLTVMAVFLLATQYVLEQGASDGWFRSDLILWLTVTAVIGGAVFVWRQLSYRQPIVSLRPLGDRNFSIGAVMNFILGVNLFGGMFVLPLFLGQVLRYSASQVGTTLVVSGLTMFLTSPLVGRFIRRIEPRITLITGFLLAAFGLLIGARVNQNWGFWDFAIMQAIRAFGTMVVAIGGQQMSVATMPAQLMKEASGLYNLIRNVGGAVGLALLSTVLSHQTALHLADLTAAVSAADADSAEMLSNLGGLMAQASLTDPDGAGRKAFAGLLRQKAAMLAFADCFAFLGIGCLIAAALAFFTTPAKAAAAR